jgi:hypothetical protein
MEVATRAVRKKGRACRFIRCARATHPDTVALLDVMAHKVDEMVELDLALARLFVGICPLHQLLRRFQLRREWGTKGDVKRRERDKAEREV